MRGDAPVLPVNSRAPSRRSSAERKIPKVFLLEISWPNGHYMPKYFNFPSHGGACPTERLSEPWKAIKGVELHNRGRRSAKVHSGAHARRPIVPVSRNVPNADVMSEVSIRSS